MSVSLTSHPCQRELSLALLFSAILTAWRWNFKLDLICISLVTEMLIISLSASQPFVFSLVTIFFGLLPIFNWVIYFLDRDFLKFFSYFQYQFFFGFAVDKNHFPFWALWLCPNDAVLCYTELFSLMRSYLLIIDLSAYANDGLFKKYFSVLMSLGLLPTSIRFRVSGLMLKSLIHLELGILQVVPTILRVFSSICNYQVDNLLKKLPFSQGVFLASLSYGHRYIDLYPGL